MVLVERNTENMRNGRRSRGPSPNGQGGTPDSSSDDDSTKKTGKSSKSKSEYEEKIRVGRDYQVQCPEFVPQPERKPEALPDRALLVWSPTKDIPESKLEDYISVAKERYGYNGEQALGMLFWHKHDLERAVLDLANFTPFPDEWSVEDKVLFEQAFQFHGKSFHRIRQMLPDKSIASLVKYYYSWKKTRSRTSVMDRHEKLKTKEGSSAGGNSENGSENGSNEESDSDDKKWSMHRGIQRASGSPNVSAPPADDHTSPNFATPSQHNHPSVPFFEPAAAATSAAAAKQAMKSVDGAQAVLNMTTNTCFGCGVLCTFTNISPHGALCSSCFHHWRRTGALRPTSGPLQSRRCRSNGMERFKRKPPRGMYINHDDIVALATQDDDLTANGTSGGAVAATAMAVNGGGGASDRGGSSYRLDDPLNVLDREIVSMLTKIQSNKQTLGSLRHSSANAANGTHFELLPGGGGDATLLAPADLSALRPSEASTRINPRWNNEEHQLAVEGMRRFGKDFTAIAELIGTKTEAHLRTFYVNYKRKFHLDLMLKEFDARQQRKLEQMRRTTLGNDAATTGEMVVGGGTTAVGESDEDVVMETDPGQF